MKLSRPLAAAVVVAGITFAGASPAYAVRPTAAHHISVPKSLLHLKLPPPLQQLIDRILAEVCAADPFPPFCPIVVPMVSTTTVPPPVVTTTMVPPTSTTMVPPTSTSTTTTVSPTTTTTVPSTTTTTQPRVVITLPSVPTSLCQVVVMGNGVARCEQFASVSSES